MDTMNPNPTASLSTDAAPTGVRAKLAALRENKAAAETVLPVSGLRVAYPAPELLTHDQVVAAAKMAGKDKRAVGKTIVAQTCTFEGERLSVEEIGTILPNKDVVHLIGLVVGDDEGDDETSSGN